MTAPFAPPMPWEAKVIALGMLAVVAAIPFARRGDAAGLLASSAIVAAALATWALLIRGMVLGAIRRRRGRSASR